jgi:hypothetical protein
MLEYEEIHFNDLAAGTTGVETEELTRDNVAQLILLKDVNRCVLDHHCNEISLCILILDNLAIKVSFAAPRICFGIRSTVMSDYAKSNSY